LRTPKEGDEGAQKEQVKPYKIYFEAGPACWRPIMRANELLDGARKSKRSSPRLEGDNHRSE
jgi:hypothetical protein